MIRRRREFFMKGAVAVGFVPLDADQLLIHTKLSPTSYQKNVATGLTGYAYRDIDYIDNSEIKYDAGATPFEYIGFYNKTLGGPNSVADFDYSIHIRTPLNRMWVYERGVFKFNLGFTALANLRVKKIAGAAEFYKNDVLGYTSLQNFSGGQFGLLIRTINFIMNAVFFKL